MRSLTVRVSMRPKPVMSVAGKNVANKSILHNCVTKYIAPAWMHFQNTPYSDLKVIKKLKVYKQKV